MKQSAHLTIRPATDTDQVAIRTLVRSERLNPCGLDWPNFLVAVSGRGLVGAVQLRRHRDGSRELGSLVVRKEARCQGIASQLINTLLAGANERVLLITVEAFAARYERWGFRQIEPAAAPAAIRRNYRIGSLASVTALLRLRRIRRLVILDRDTAVRLRSPAASVDARA
jgi:amino-acid N-acetyltransferase